jgi:hypothetical protein
MLWVSSPLLYGVPHALLRGGAYLAGQPVRARFGVLRVVPVHPEGLPTAGESLGDLLVGRPLCSLIGNPGQGGRVIEVGPVNYPSLSF